jgi:hypothetical protein
MYPASHTRERRSVVCRPLRIHALNQDGHADAVDDPAEEENDQHDPVDQGKVGQKGGLESRQPVGLARIGALKPVCSRPETIMA